MADPERFDADPDPTFHADAELRIRIQIFFAWERKKNFFKILQNLTCVIFAVTVQEEVGGIRCEG